MPRATKAFPVFCFRENTNNTRPKVISSMHIERGENKGARNFFKLYIQIFQQFSCEHTIKQPVGNLQDYLRSHKNFYHLGVRLE